MSFTTAGDASNPLLAGSALAAYIVCGSVLVSDPRLIGAHDLAVLEAGAPVAFTAMGPADVLVLGGPPLDTPIVRHGPFVMNSDDKIDEAMRSYERGYMGRIEAGRIVARSVLP